jgi:tungstate transport system ATP-binding protein
MTMRAPVTNLPLHFESVGVVAGHVTILDGVTLSILPGAPTVLIGPNGSGKTTLLRAAMGLIRPSRGRIAWADSDSLPPLKRAIVFQRPTMLRRSVAANLRYALANAGVPRREWPSRTAELLALVGMSDLAERPARRLSGGEQQRLALARARPRSGAAFSRRTHRQPRPRRHQGDRGHRPRRGRARHQGGDVHA